MKTAAEKGTMYLV